MDKNNIIKRCQNDYNLISNTTTKKGLKIEATLDRNEYEKGIKVSDKELVEINIKFNKKNPKWNYTINQSKKRKNK